MNAILSAPAIALSADGFYRYVSVLDRADVVATQPDGSASSLVAALVFRKDSELRVAVLSIRFTASPAAEFVSAIDGARDAARKARRRSEIAVIRADMDHVRVLVGPEGVVLRRESVISSPVEVILSFEEAERVAAMLRRRMREFVPSDERESRLVRLFRDCARAFSPNPAWAL